MQGINNGKYFKAIFGVESEDITCSSPTSMVYVHCHCGQL